MNLRDCITEHELNLKLGRIRHIIPVNIIKFKTLHPKNCIPHTHIQLRVPSGDFLAFDILSYCISGVHKKAGFTIRNDNPIQSIIDKNNGAVWP